MAVFQLPPVIPFGVLRQRHDDYRRDSGTWQELLDLYAGGYQLAANAKSYIYQLANESDTRYADRLKAAAYIGYLGQIVDYFVSSLFSQDLVVTEAPDAADPTTPGGKSDAAFYSAFAHDADLAGNPFAAVIRTAFRNAILLKKSLIGVDFPKAPEAAQVVTRADEDAVGTNRAYVFEVPLEQCINWEVDRWGNWEFVVLYSSEAKQASPASMRGASVTHRFKVWTRESESGGAHWWLYEVVEDPAQPLQPDAPVKLVDDAATSFQVVPIVSIEVKAGLWVGNKLGPLAKEHYQRRASLVAAENVSMVAIPFVKRGPEIGPIGGAVPSETQQNPRRGADPVGRMNARGWVEIGSQDELGFAEPAGACYQQVREELSDLKDEMHRIVHQMAAAVTTKASNTARSGDSKRQDRAAEAVVLGQFGRDVRDWARRIYDVIAGGRAEQVVWTPRGLDNFDTEERSDLLAEAVQVDLVAIPSKTFKAAYKTQIAMGLVPNAPPETQDLIRKEIQDGVEAEDELRSLMNDAKKDAIQNPPPPAPAPGPGGERPAADDE
jgi:hypothetical protein